MDTNQQDERAPHCLRLGASRTVLTVGRYNYSLTAAGQTACKQTNAARRRDKALPFSSVAGHDPFRSYPMRMSSMLRCS